MKGATADNVKSALALIDHFADDNQMSGPQQAEQLVAKMFAACGYDVPASPFIGRDQRVDCYFRGLIDRQTQTIAAEVRTGRKWQATCLSGRGKHWAEQRRGSATFCDLNDRTDRAIYYAICGLVSGRQEGCGTPQLAAPVNRRPNRGGAQVWPFEHP